MLLTTKTDIDADHISVIVMQERQRQEENIC